MRTCQCIAGRGGEDHFPDKQDPVELNVYLRVIGVCDGETCFSRHFRIFANSDQTLFKIVNTHNSQESDKRNRKRIAFAIFE